MIFGIYQLVSAGGGDVVSSKTDRETNEDRRGCVCSRLRGHLGEKPGNWSLIESRPFSSRVNSSSLAGGGSGDVRLQNKKPHGKTNWASLLPLTGSIQETETLPEILRASSDT